MDLPLCGHGWKGFGCGKPIERVSDLFRCADCKAPFHHWCLVDHFADGVPREVEGHGKVSRHKTPHAFALETAFLVSELLKRDAKVERVREVIGHHWLTALKCDEATKTDVATCYCTVWKSDPKPSVGEAVEAWIDHVMSHVNGVVA